VSVEHYHPERNLLVHFPSGFDGDFQTLIIPVKGTYHYTTYGYDPATRPIGHFFITVETRGGGMVDYHFESMAELEATLDRIRMDVAVVQ
jgi:hypothetical protein